MAKKIFTSIDIGSSSIKIIVCELYQGKLNVLASVNSPSSGIKKGIVTDDELAKEEENKKAINEDHLVKIDKAINIPMYEAENMINEDY